MMHDPAHPGEILRCDYIWSYGAARQAQRLEHAPRLYIELAEARP